MIETQGNLFDYPVIGHGVNCEGAMGAGIAVQFKRRYPGLYTNYRRLCLMGALHPGDVYVHEGSPLIFNLAIKDRWRDPARLDWLEAAVQTSVEQLHRRGLTTLALPRIGCGLGGLEWSRVRDRLQHLETGITFQILTEAP